MSYEQYCEALFSENKSNILHVSEDEIQVLKKIQAPGQVHIDYEILDEQLSKYFSNKGTKVFTTFDDIYEKDPWKQYIQDLEERIENFQSYKFVYQTIKSIESKFRIYSFLFDSAILNSKSYTDEKDEKTSSMFNDKNEELSKASETLYQANAELEKTSKKLSIAQDSIQNILPNLLTVLGIFISVIIAVVIIYITFFLEKDVNILLNSILQLQIGKYVLSAHLLGNVMFLLMFMIARLTNRNILSTCGEYKLDKENYSERDEIEYESSVYRNACANCKYNTKCSIIRKLSNKAGYIIGFNWLMLILYFVVYTWWIFDYYWYKGYHVFFSSPDFVGLLISGITIFLVTLFMCNLFKSKSKQ